jgi:phosphohistidine phosphatase
MKRLLLIRHAKATHDTDYKDFERPLKKSGIKDSETMAERLKAQDYIPQIVISSPSLRTKTTADIFAEHLSVSKIQTDKAIYEASEEDLLNIINEFPDQYNFIALVGHNPAISQLLYYLTGQIKNVPPCAIAVIDFEFGEWKLISGNTGNLVHYDEV